MNFEGTIIYKLKKRTLIFFFKEINFEANFFEFLSPPWVCHCIVICSLLVYVPQAEASIFSYYSLGCLPVVYSD